MTLDSSDGIFYTCTYFMNKYISPDPDWFPLFWGCQVLEAHILAALTQETQHLILIGERGVAREKNRRPFLRFRRCFRKKEDKTGCG